MRKTPSVAATAARMPSARRTASRLTLKRLENDTVTIRERDSMQQERVHISEVAGIVSEKTDMRKLLELLA
jgi:hypothetical protein